MLANVLQFCLILTPRQREILRIALESDLSKVQSDIDNFRDKSIVADCNACILDRYPSYTFDLSNSWRTNVKLSFQGLLDDLEGGRLPRPRTISEQISLNLAVADADGAGDSMLMAAHVLEFPPNGADKDWSDVLSGSLDRFDVELLYSDIPEERRNVMLTTPPDTWFDWFLDIEPRFRINQC